jgi:hypothetical protein
MEARDWRRLVPPPRRRPGLLEIAVRWRLELLAAAAIAGIWSQVGTAVIGVVAAVALVVVATVPAARQIAMRSWEVVVVPHRVRSALLHAGVADRHGRLPWVLWAVPAGSIVRVDLGLRAGIIPDDVAGAAPVIATACGAAQVAVIRIPHRPDRVTLLIARPRWGLP